MGKHTPGPWEASAGDVYAEPTSGFPMKVAAAFAQRGDVVQMEQVAANARLIAAAPELLEALEAAIKWAAPMAEAPVEARPEWFDKCRAAIAKATGESQ